MIPKILAATFAALLLIQPSGAQKIRSYLKPADSLSAVASGTFSSADGGFSVGLPKRFGGFSGESGIEYSWSLKEGFFVSGITDRAGDIENSGALVLESDKITDETYERFVRNYFETPGKIETRKSRRIDFRGRKGYETRLVLPDSVIVVRVIWHIGRAYKLGVLLAGEQRGFETAALGVFETLTYKSKAEMDAEYERLVILKTPAPLPQLPRPARTVPDTADNYLNGKVKIVVLYNERVRGSGAGRPKLRTREENYDETGMLISRIGFKFNTGAPSSITAFGFVDGSRVSRSVDLDSDQILLAVSVGRVAPVEKKRDPRFDMRFEYTVDETGRPVEQMLFNNAGDVISRTTFEYGPGTIDEKRYFDGKLNQHYRTTFDAARNEVEFRSRPVVGTLSVSVYRIEATDAAGN
jgi:hypothetical protein